MSKILAEVNYLSVVIAGVAAWLFGAVYYTLLGKPWMAAQGKTAEQCKVEMAGKSGTAQVKRITQRDREMKNTDSKKWEWKFRDHALFVGFAPYHAPRYACAVVVEHGGGGSSVSGPMVRDILLQAQKTESARRKVRQVAEVTPAGRG